jgi:uncharacterized protein YbaP (TraB family)
MQQRFHGLARFLAFVVLLLACGSSKEHVDAPKPPPSAVESAAPTASAEPSAQASASGVPVQTNPPDQAANVWHPILYKVGGTKPSYLFGTIHVPDSRLSVPDNLKAAYQASDEVVTELPLDDTSPAHAMQLASMPAGKSLSTELPKATYDRLKAAFDQKGLGMAFPMFEHLKVWAVGIQVELLDHWQQMMSGAKPIDIIIHDQAKAAGKRTSGLETEPEQLAVFDSLTKDEQSRFLEEALDERDKADREHKDVFGELMTLYLAGNEAPLLAALNAGFDLKRPLDQKLMKRLITDRNKIMSDRISARIKASPARTFMFAVGAAHLLGDDGIVSQLRKKGMTVERVQ